MIPPGTPQIMGGRCPPIAPLRGDSRKALAPRAVVAVKDQWLLLAGCPRTGRPGAVVAVKDQWLLLAGRPRTGRPSTVVAVKAWWSRLQGGRERTPSRC